MNILTYYFFKVPVPEARIELEKKPDDLSKFQRECRRLNRDFFYYGRPNAIEISSLLQAVALCRDDDPVKTDLVNKIFNTRHCDLSRTLQLQEMADQLWEFALFQQNTAFQNALIARGAHPTETSQSFIQAAKDGTLSLDTITSHPELVNMCDSEGNTVLIWAVRNQQLESIRCLLSLGANPNAQNDSGQTACMLCPTLGILTLLKEHEADLTLKDDEKANGLLYAASWGKPSEFLDCFLQAGVDINAVDSQGISALCQAVADAHLTTLQFLIERGATVKQSDLLIAIQKGHADIVKYLITSEKGVSPHFSANTYTPLMTAAFYGQEEIVQLLLDQKVSASATYKNLTALHFAASQGHLNSVKQLFPLTRAEDPILDAAYGGHTACVAFFLDEGVSANYSKNGNTPLLDAARKGHKEIVHLLLSKGADPSFQNDKGMTPVHWAVHFGDLDIVADLVEAGGSLTTSSLNNSIYHELKRSRRKGYRALLKQIAQENPQIAKDDKAFVAQHRAAFAYEIGPIYNMKNQLVGGLSHYQINGKQIDADIGYYMVGWLKFMARSTTKLEDPCYQPLRELFRYSADIYQHPPEEICARLQKGIPTLIPLDLQHTHNRHAIGGLCLEDRMILCNRNVSPQINSFSLNREKWTPDLVRTLLHSHCKSEKEIIALTGATQPEEIRSPSLYAQLIGNCTYTSAELVAYSLLRENTPKEASFLFESLVKNNRTQAIHEYLKTTASLSYPPDTAFLREVVHQSLKLTSVYGIKTDVSTKHVDKELDQLFNTEFNEQFIETYKGLLK